jgi:hypothetical protein
VGQLPLPENKPSNCVRDFLSFCRCHSIKELFC